MLGSEDRLEVCCCLVKTCGVRRCTGTPRGGTEGDSLEKPRKSEPCCWVQAAQGKADKKLDLAGEQRHPENLCSEGILSAPSFLKAATKGRAVGATDISGEHQQASPIVAKARGYRSPPASGQHILYGKGKWENKRER